MRSRKNSQERASRDELWLVLVGLSAWFAPRIYRAVRAQWTAFRARLLSWFGEAPSPRLTAAQERWLRDQSLSVPPRSLFAVIATPDLRTLRNSVGSLCFVEDQAIFFCRGWGRLVARRIGPLKAVKARRGLLLDELAVAAPDGVWVRFDLLAGQLQTARAEVRRSPPWPDPPRAPQRNIGLISLIL